MNQDYHAGASSHSPPGKLGKYKVLAHLGRGGMADVYLAVMSGPAGFNKLHVLKHLRREAFDSEEALHMFAQEARVSALLNHPNVVHTFEVGEDNGNVFMVMEYLEGQTLQGVIRRTHRMSPSQGLQLPMKLRVVADVLSGLHYAHELRDLHGEPLDIVHRDVTPHNIFITYDGGVKLLDFGVAKTATSATRVGTIKGKVAYLAPEQVSSAALVCRRTDIFQCGIVLWEGLFGRRFWEGINEFDVLRMLGKGILPNVEPTSDVDPVLVQICRRAIAPNPDDRFETAEAFAKAIDAYMETRGMRSSAKDVGARVGKLFAERRAEVRSVVQQRLKEIQADESLAPTLGEGSAVIPTLPADVTRSTAQGRRMTLGGSRMGSYHSVPSTVAEPSSHFTVSIPWTARTRLFLGALGVAGIAAAALYYQQAAPPAVASVQGSVQGPAPVQPHSVRVELSIETVPANARLFLDGAPIGNSPHVTTVVKDGSHHEIRAEADGYEIAKLPVLFDGDAKHLIRMARAPSLPTTTAEPRENPTPTLRSRPIVGRGRPMTSPSPGAAKPLDAQPAAGSTGVASPAGGPAAAPKIDNVDPWQ